MAKQKLNIQKQGFPSVADAYNDVLGIKSDNQYVNLPLSLLEEIDNQPFPINESKIEQIADSIENVGVIEPIIVVKDGEKYKILSGRHRFRACKKLGKDDIPCYIRDVKADDDIARYIIIATNTDRNNEYKPSIYAKAYAEQLSLMKKLGKKSTVSAIAEQNGLSRKQIYRYIRLTHLISEMQGFVDNGIISIETAVEFSFLSIEKQSSLYKYIGNFEKSYISSLLNLSAAKYIRELDLSDDEFNENIQDIVNGKFDKSNEKITSETEQIYSDESEVDNSDEDTIQDIEVEKTEVPTTNEISVSEKNFETEITDNYEDNVSNETDIETQLECKDEVAVQNEHRAIDITADMFKRSPEEINDMCDSGMFNEIIEGYILLACDEAGIKLDMQLNRLFDMYSAQDARDRYIK
ncbi:ParB/RepB/Spo0J family partition protein [Pseudoruminococcus massiliensis]|uniref:ParB/RepB/Spo0J family partition protein n=1 Tax=Pseudoruminococcus massiliensis TaxID=2086583 RepID=UPI003FD7D1AC